MDFVVFLTIKKQLKEKRFQSLQELRKATADIIYSFDKGWYTDMFDQLVHRHRRCVALHGVYFEKLRQYSSSFMIN